MSLKEEEETAFVSQGKGHVRTRHEVAAAERSSSDTVWQHLGSGTFQNDVEIELWFKPRSLAARADSHDPQKSRTSFHQHPADYSGLTDLANPVLLGACLNRFSASLPSVPTPAPKGKPPLLAAGEGSSTALPPRTSLQTGL